MYRSYLGQPVLWLRHLNGRGLPAPELRVLCSTKRGAKRPLVLSDSSPTLCSLTNSQSRNSFREPIRERLERRMSNLESRHFWQTNTSGTLDFRTFAQDRWIQVWHSLHSIIGRPANGFMQKQVTRSQESSSAGTHTRVKRSENASCAPCPAGSLPPAQAGTGPSSGAAVKPDPQHTHTRGQAAESVRDKGLWTVCGAPRN